MGLADIDKSGEFTETRSDQREHPPTRAEKGEVIGGGYIIAHRNTNGRIRTSKMPFEHPSQAAALDEATRLSEKHPGRVYVILAVAGTVLNDKVK